MAPGLITVSLMDGCWMELVCNDRDCKTRMELHFSLQRSLQSWLNSNHTTNPQQYWSVTNQMLHWKTPLGLSVALQPHLIFLGQLWALQYKQRHETIRQHPGDSQEDGEGSGGEAL